MNALWGCHTNSIMVVTSNSIWNDAWQSLINTPPVDCRRGCLGIPHVKGVLFVNGGTRPRRLSLHLRSSLRGWRGMGCLSGCAMVHGCDRCGVGGMIPSNRVSTDKNGSKMDTRRDVVLDDIGIRIKVGFCMRYYWESGIIGVSWDKWSIISDYGSLGWNSQSYWILNCFKVSSDTSFIAHF